MIFPKKKFDSKVYGWKRNDGIPNIGDELARKIVKAIILFRDIEMNNFSNKFKGRLFSIGSVMHFANTKDIIWGTGINGKVDRNLHKFNTLDVRAVRGPKTRNFLLERKINVPEVYGDPALLSSLFFPKELFLKEKKNEFLVIPHMSEVEIYSQKFSQDILCSPLQNPYQFIEKIVNAKKVYSSSLHGIILAEAYNIPVVWLKSDNGEDEFKYYDYYEGTGRYKSLKKSKFEDYECLEFDKILDLHEIQKNLLKAFPYEFWN